MDKAADFGILTFYKERNYGAILQAYSLQKTIDELGFTSHFINWHDHMNRASNNSTFKKVFDVIKTYGLNYSLYRRTQSVYSKVSTKFTNFVFDNLNVDYSPAYDKNDLEKIEPLYKGFVSGSDMVWTDIGQTLSTYFMDFAPYEKRGSYAPSLTGTKGLSDDAIEYLSEKIRGVKYLSFRENEGVSFAKNVVGVSSSLVVDPTLLHTKKEWISLLNINDCKKTKYILFYMFGGVPRKVFKNIKKFSTQNGFAMRFIPMTPKELFYENKHGYDGVYGPKEFTELFLNASFVVTNSYHGFLFSLISNIPFVVYHRESSNKWKANEERMTSLLSQIGEEKRFLFQNDAIDDSFIKIDYGRINPIIEKKRVHSLDYIKSMLSGMSNNSISTKKQVFNNVCDLDRKQCTGCEACKNICPKQAIEMLEDKDGFFYPSINYSLCIHCSLCSSRCPSIKSLEMNYPKVTKFGYSTLPEQYKSASGGAFLAFAYYFIKKQHALVYGAAFDGIDRIAYREVSNTDELSLLQGSKYVRADIAETYKNIQKLLKQGKTVLFSGLPCQVAGLYSVIGCDYDNLLTIDLICHGTPSLSLWKSYVQYEFKNKQIDAFSFRNKDNEALERSAFEIKYSSGHKVFKLPQYESPYYRLFIENKTFRPSCYYCKYANQKRVGDITIGDCDSWRTQKPFAVEKAKSIVLANTTKGSRFLKEIDEYFLLEDLDFLEESKINTTLCHPTEMPSERRAVYDLIKEKGWGVFRFKKKFSFLKAVLLKKRK